MEKKYAELRGLIVANYGNQSNFADTLGISRVSLNNKLNGKVQFTQGEINDAVLALNLNPEQVYRIFFAT